MRQLEYCSFYPCRCSRTPRIRSLFQETARLLLETAGEKIHFCAWSADSWRRVLKSNTLIAPSNFSSELLPAVLPASALPSRVSCNDSRRTLRGTCRVDDGVNEESIIWHTGLDVVIEVNIEVGTSWSLADRLASIADLWQSARWLIQCRGYSLPLCRPCG